GAPRSPAVLPPGPDLPRAGVRLLPGHPVHALLARHQHELALPLHAILGDLAEDRLLHADLRRRRGRDRRSAPSTAARAGATGEPGRPPPLRYGVSPRLQPAARLDPPDGAFHADPTPRPHARERTRAHPTPRAPAGGSGGRLARG